MKKTTKYSLAAAAAITALTLTPLAQARGFGRGGPGGHGGRDGFGPRMAAELDLSDQQKVQFKKLRAEMETDTAEVKVALDNKREELHQLWMAENPDERAILAKHAEMDPLRAQLRERGVQLKLAMHALLTPEQRAKMQELKTKRGKGKRGKGKRGKGGMGGGFGGGWGADLAPNVSN